MLKWSVLALIGVLLLRAYDPWPIETLRLKYLDVLITSKEQSQSQTVSLYNIDETELSIGGHLAVMKSLLRVWSRCLLSCLR